MKSEICRVKIKYRNLERDFDDVHVRSQTNAIETCSRKDNIVFYGIVDKQNETNDECAAGVRKFMVEVLKIPQNCVMLLYSFDATYLTPERPMGHICPMFFSCICYMNITKKNILNSRQFYFR